ncbi:hypothetical protein I79_011808 [Cricetulus griseus]|uniref:Uncharacterized protein n=1 Tax=Cricetulus griseus TaxID=10029 RepID=G3HM60_CRIGR|nr:hypothetical protein I79_011808 [Cricetulus griseus]
MGRAIWDREEPSTVSRWLPERTPQPAGMLKPSQGTSHCPGTENYNRWDTCPFWLWSQGTKYN